MRDVELPVGWTQERIRNVVDFYDSQSDEDVAMEIAAAFDERDSVVMEIPVDIAPEIARRVLELNATGPVKSVGVNGQRLSVLSDREFRIASLVAQGLANQRIAEELSVQEETVRRTVRSVIRKLHAESRDSITSLMAIRQEA